MSAMTQEFITSAQLQSYFVDKDTGAPLAGGYVEFFIDNAQRTTGKDVYQKVPFNPAQTDTDGNPIYDYVTLGNVVQLSAVGTFMDNNGNDIAVYYYPWDADGNLQSYFISVFNSLGVPQFTREGWPNSFATDEPGADGSNVSENQISNPQFVVVNFDPTTTLTIPFTGSAVTTVSIAPDWDLIVDHSQTTTLNIARISIAGSSNFPTQAPYYLQITPGINIGQVSLVQTLDNNPGIWSPGITPTGFSGGYVATTMVLGPNTGDVTVEYIPSSGTGYVLLDESNASNDYIQFNATTQLPPSDNSQTADVGNVQIVINIPLTGTTTISSIQVVGLDGNIDDVAFTQDTVNRQIDHLFNYYNPLLQAKPISSYLIGWDFPLNPTQVLGAGTTGTPLGPFASGVNSSNYVWDQTILFQSANSGVTVSRVAHDSLALTAAVDTQLAIVQYLEAPVANKILTQTLSSLIRAHTSNTTGLPGTISLWYTTDTTLPNVAAGTSKSLVISLDGNGFPTCGVGVNGYGNWTQVARSSLGNANFTVPFNNAPFNNGFTGWKDTTSGSSTATYFAIVVGFGLLSATKSLTLQSCSLVPGQIPTIPAPQSITQVLSECQRYYWDTFPIGIAPGANKGYPGAIGYSAQVSGAHNYAVPILFPVQMRAIPTTFFYNPTSDGATNNWYNRTSGGTGAISGAGAINGGTTVGIGQEAASIVNPQAGADTAGNDIWIHLAFECRLGIVL